MRVYLDNCCLNRPFDDQSQIRVRLEAEAKLYIQELNLLGQLELAWSYILDYENGVNPFDERRRAIGRWKLRADILVMETPAILRDARELHKRGLRNEDALHVACALAARCDYIVTTDDSLLKRGNDIRGIRIADPPTFVRETTDGH
jgi:predicted nucleic acid-binding protein